jgi:predicted O-linked N-acetylglucosamine transferase (SPINDLY family)
LPPPAFAAAVAAGLAAHKRGDLAEAVARYRAAYAVLADGDIAHNLGAALRDLKRPGEAAEWFRRCIAARPDHALAHANLGLCLLDAGARDAALAAFAAALALRPRQVEALLGRAMAHRRGGDVAACEADLRAALAAVPGHAGATIELGRLLTEAKRLDAALAVYDAALERAPADPRLAGHKGTVLFELARYEEAQRLLASAHAAEPREMAWAANLSLVLLARHRHAEAVAMTDRALALDPDNPKLLVNKGAALKALGLPSEAVPPLRRAAALRPGYAIAHNNLGNVLREQGLIPEAVTHFRAAVEADPAYADAHSNLVYTLNSLDTASPAEIAAAHRRFGDALQAAVPAPAPHGNDRDPERRLRIGYVSPDFVAHSVAYFVENLLAHHDRGRVEVFCYATGKLTDGLTPRLKAQADHWRDIAVASDAEAESRIRADGIDILVDLAGHTANNRMALFARRPAPVQATWIGYPNTTGLTAIGYRLVDAVTDPPGEADSWASETLLRLPRGFLCYRPSDFAPEVAARPSLAGTPPVFGSFNALAKMNDRVVATWSRILAAVPGSRLMLKQKAFADPGVQRLYRDGFARHGIGPERLDLIGRTPLVGDHLALYGRMDIALDPFPYNGTTTTCEALYQGVPVVTLLGTHHVARVGASLLRQVGLDELVAPDIDAYVGIAVALARDPARLAAVSAGLRPAMARSALLDAPGFVAEVEAAFRDMWRRWCAAGQGAAAPPAPAPPPVASPGPADPALVAAIAAGAAAFEAGQTEAALTHFAEAARRFPESAHAALNLGATLRRLGRLGEARAALAHAAACDPGWAPPHANLGGVLLDLGDADAAERACRQALALDPRNRIAHANLANVMSARQREDLAIAGLETALSLGPPDATILCNLAAACARAGRLADAAAHGEAAIRLAPDLAEGHANLASIYARQGRRAAARAATETAVRLKPELRHAWSNLLLGLNYADDIDAAAVTAEHRAWGRTQADLAAPADRGAADRDPGRVLRIGFVSADLYGHSVAFFLKPLFDALDRRAVEICCYADVPVPDPYTGLLRAKAGLWRDCIGMTDAAVARLVASDGIDILVDLGGHTAKNRLGVFARRPAPVQATWLGYPATTGLAAIDHRLVDAITDPPGSEALSVEGLARLPGCFLCYEPPAIPLQPGPLPAPVLGRISFGSFNNVSKINAATVALWADVLAAVPASRMILKSIDTRDAATRARLLEMFASRGVAADRVDFLDWQPDLKRHLEMYRQVDIALDTFPYNGTTTTCEAHWMGVPVVTLAGDRHAARVGASLSHALGLDHLVAHDAARFVAIAAGLASDLPALAAFRAGARARMQAAPLLDAAGFAARFAAWARRAWREFLDRTAPVAPPAAAPGPPAPAEAALRQAATLRRLGRPAEARAELERAVALAPDWPLAHANLGSVLVDLGEAAAAEAACRRALALDPAFRPALVKLGLAQMAQLRHDLAIEAFERALALGPPDATLLTNLAAACGADGRLADAAAHGEAALRLDPSMAEAHANLAGTYSRQGRRDAARAAAQAALRLKPDLRAVWSNMLLELNYRDDIGAAELTAEHRAWGETQAALARPARAGDRDPARRLRVGFVSADFFGHSVAFFLKPLFDRLDPQRVEIACYSDVRAPDAFTEAFRARAAIWRVCAGLSDEAVAGMVEGDRIDILVDLAGHTGPNRLGVFARRPAPVQLTWLGYPATTGLAAIDHRLVDAITDPPGSEGLAVETLVRLPGCFLCYEPIPSPAVPGPLPALGGGGVTFGSFNALTKITPATVRLWAGAMAAVPGSRLLLKARMTRDGATRDRLLALFAAAGVAADRIAFAPWQLQTRAHLETYHQVDIALDSFPYNGTTTTCEAHWMGVPVVTLAGDRHAARVGASLSHALGLDHLVARDAAGFAAIAARLAADLPALAAFRAGARARMLAAPLLDAAGFARRFEAMLRGLWDRHCGVAAPPPLPAHRLVALAGPGSPVLKLRDDPDDDAVAELMAGGAALATEHALLGRVLRPGDAVVDLAPGPGARALLVASHVGPAGSVRTGGAPAADAALLADGAARAGFAWLHAGGPDDALAGAGPPDLLVLPGEAPPDPASLGPGRPLGRLLVAATPPLVLVTCGPGAALRGAWSEALAGCGLQPCLPVPGLGILAPAALLDGADGPGRDARQDGPLFACAPSRAAVLAARGVFVPALPPLPPVPSLDRAALAARLPFARILAGGWATATLPPELTQALAGWLAAHDPASAPPARLASLCRAARDLAAADTRPLFAVAMTRVRLELELGRRDAAWTILQRFMRNQIPVAVDLPFLPPAARFDALPLGRAFAPWYRAAIYETAARCIGGWRGEAARLDEALCAEACASGQQSSATSARLVLLRARSTAPRTQEPGPAGV